MTAPNTPAAPQQLVEEALARATLPTVVRVTERWEANLRWASNELTTNGEMHGRTLTVVATAPVEGGTAVGTVSQEVAQLGEVAAVVAAAERAARGGPPSENAAPLVEGEPSPAFGDPPATTGIEVLAPVAEGLGAAFAAARRQGHLLYGFAEHVVTTTYLGSTTGLRLRGVQPTGRFELNGKTDDLSASAWVGVPSRDFTDVDVAALYDRAAHPARLGRAPHRPAGRALRDPAASGSGGGPARVPAVDGQRPRCRGGPQRLRCG